MWVVYSAHRKGRFDIFACGLTLNFAAGGRNAVKVKDEEQWTTAAKSAANLSPTACTDQGGDIWVGCQQWEDGGRAGVAVTHRERAMADAPVKLAADFTVTGIDCWHPVMATGPSGEQGTADDIYLDGDYDVELETHGGAKPNTVQLVANSSRFEARPSVCYDAKGRLWIAHEEGPEKVGQGLQPSRTAATRSTTPAASVWSAWRTAS